eukprot:3451276-Ditylum_brightwellii.AAC.1
MSVSQIWMPPSYRGRQPDTVLAAAEKAKKDKYLEACLERRRTFTPLVYSVDGMAANKAKAAEKRMASLLAGKLHRQYSKMVGYVRAQMVLAVVRTNTVLLRGPREPGNRTRSRPSYEDGAGVALYHPSSL